MQGKSTHCHGPGNRSGSLNSDLRVVLRYTFFRAITIFRLFSTEIIVFLVYITLEKYDDDDDKRDIRRSHTGDP